MNLARFDLVTLGLFVAVARLGSISAGARQSHLAVAAASKRISDLEAAVGAPLLYRHAAGVELTEAGQACFRHAVGILQDVERMAGALSDFAAGTRGYRVLFDLNMSSMRIETVNGAVYSPIGSGPISDSIITPRVGAAFASTTLQPNDFRLTLRDNVVSFGMAWPGFTPRVNTGLDPSGASLYGVPMYLTVASRDVGGDTVSRLASARVRRSTFTTGGGPCADSTPPESYCPR
jgi:hypothetical protein